MRWRKVTLVGVGLLGGSLGMALRQRRLAGQVHGFVRRKESIAECLDAGAVDSASCDLPQSVSGADLIVLCTPLAQMSGLARSSLEAVSPGALVTDVGSVKAPLVAELEPLYAARGAFFVGSHPMAGSEKMGVRAARADLFKNAVCVVTPTAQTAPEHSGAIRELWRDTGARTLDLPPGLHDELAARSSHLPHVLAAHLAGYVLGAGSRPDQTQLCANGFRDSTRIASGSPEMWRDIVLMNREQVSRSLREFQERLTAFAALLAAGEAGAIESFFREAKGLRDSWSDRAASRSPE